MTSSRLLALVCFTIASVGFVGCLVAGGDVIQLTVPVWGAVLFLLLLVGSMFELARLYLPSSLPQRIVPYLRLTPRTASIACIAVMLALIIRGAIL